MPIFCRSDAGRLCSAVIALLTVVCVCLILSAEVSAWVLASLVPALNAACIFGKVALIRRRQPIDKQRYAHLPPVRVAGQHQIKTVLLIGRKPLGAVREQYIDCACVKAGKTFRQLIR